MSYVARSISPGAAFLKGVGWLFLAILLAFLVFTAPLWLHSRTVEYIIFPGADGVVLHKGGTLTAAEDLASPGCEILGKVIKRGGEIVIRYRFPNDPDLERCFLESVPATSRIKKVSPS